MSSLNKVMLIGNLGRDPEIRKTNNGNAVGNLAIATAERRKDRDGNWIEETEWHRVVVFGKTAENCGKFLSKGRQVAIEGRLKTRKYTDKDGNERSTTEIVANNVVFLSAGESKGGGQRGGRSGGSSRGGERRQQRRDDYDDRGGYDDDIPF